MELEKRLIPRSIFLEAPKGGMSPGIMWQVSDRSEHLCPLYILPHLSPKQVFIHKDDQATLYPWSRESCGTRGLKSYWVCRAEGPTELRRIPSSVNISGPLMTHRQPRLPHVTFTFLGLFPEWAVLPTPPLKIISHHKKKKKKPPFSRQWYKLPYLPLRERTTLLLL